VYQIGREHRLTGSSRAQILRRDTTQLVIHEGNELMKCLFIAGPRFFEEYRYIHGIALHEVCAAKGLACKVRICFNYRNVTFAYGIP
jgi:hypothetical protein